MIAVIGLACQRRSKPSLTTYQFLAKLHDIEFNRD